MWNFVYHAVFIIDKNLSPHWLNAVQSFWLGGLGFSCSIVWYPFIKRSLMQVGSDIIGRLSPRRKQIRIVSRICLQTQFNSLQTDDDTVDQPARPVYFIPSRWQNETINTYRDDPDPNIHGY